MIIQGSWNKLMLPTQSVLICLADCCQVESFAVAVPTADGVSRAWGRWLPQSFPAGACTAWLLQVQVYLVKLFMLGSTAASCLLVAVAIG